MKKVISVVLAVAMSLCVGLTMVGCDNEKAKDNGSIIVSTMFGAGDSHNAAFTKYNKQYTQLTGVKIEDRSGTAEGSWTEQVISDINSVNNIPDVIFHTSGAALDNVRAKFMTVADMQEAYPNFAKGIIMHDNDPASIEMKAGVQGIMYDKTAYVDADFASVAALVAKVTAGQNSNLSAQLPHYWFNHLMLSKLGVTEFNAFNGTKAYFTPEKTTLWKAAINSVVTDLRAMGSTKGDGANALPDSNFWAGTNKLMIDGSWTYGSWKTATAKDNIKFSSFPKVSMTAGGVADTDFYIGGVTNGWFVTKSAWNDTAKRSKVIAYIELMSSPNAINDYALGGGGVPANGLAIVNEDGSKPATAAFMDGVIKSGALEIIAIDDRVSAIAKNAFLSTWKTAEGLPKLLFQATAPTTAEVDTMFQTTFIDKL